MPPRDLSAQADQPFDLGRIADLGERLRPGGGQGNEQQFVTAAEQVDLLMRCPGCAAEGFEHFPRQVSRPARRCPPKHPYDEEEESQHGRQAAGDGNERAHPPSGMSARVRLVGVGGLSGGNDVFVAGDVSAAGAGRGSVATLVFSADTAGC